MNLFTYGSLMYRPVWDRVVSGSFESVAGTLRGFARRRIKGEVYPALVPAELESTVNGVVYRGLGDREIAGLDRFESEGTDYRRIGVKVELVDGVAVDAWAYQYLHRDRVDRELWDVKAFEAGGLQHFIETYCRDRTGDRR